MTDQPAPDMTHANLRRQARLYRRAAARSCLFLAFPLMVTALLFDAAADAMEAEA